MRFSDFVLLRFELKGRKPHAGNKIEQDVLINQVHEA